MSTLSTHVLDTALGKPAAGVHVSLARASDGVVLGDGHTDPDGRLREFVGTLAADVYRLRFAVADYFAATQRPTFFPEVVVVFRLGDDEHYHVPLLISPFGYSTYRGS